MEAKYLGGKLKESKMKLQKLIIPTAIVFACGMLYMYVSYNYNELKRSYAMATQEIVRADNELQKAHNDYGKTVQHLLDRINDQQTTIGLYNESYDSLKSKIDDLNSMNEYLRKTIVNNSFDERIYNDRDIKRADIKNDSELKNEESSKDSNTNNGDGS